MQDDFPELKPNYQQLINNIIKTNDSFCTYMAGIEDGFAGLILLDIQAQRCGFKNHLSDKLACLNNYLVANGKQVLMPGRFGMKCSMDLATGAAGMLEILILAKGEL